MNFKRYARKIGKNNSIMLILPKDLTTYLDLHPNDEVVIEENEIEKENGDKRKIVSFWKTGNTEESESKEKSE